MKKPIIPPITITPKIEAITAIISEFLTGSSLTSFTNSIVVVFLMCCIGFYSKTGKTAGEGAGKGF